MPRTTFPGRRALGRFHNRTNVAIVGLSRVSTDGHVVGADDDQRQAPFVGPMQTPGIVGEHCVGSDFWVRVGAE